MTLQDFFMILSAVLGAAFTLSEVLAQIPSVKANSVFQLIYGFLRSIRSRPGRDGTGVET